MLQLLSLIPPEAFGTLNYSSVFSFLSNQLSSMVQAVLQVAMSF